jgi:hypothetical protein
VEGFLSKTNNHKRYKRQAKNESTTQEYQDYTDYTNFYGTDALQEDNADDKKKDDKINGLPREIHCDLVQTLKTLCAEHSILELWNYDVSVIRNLTREDIINDLNMVKKSPVTGYEADFLKFIVGKRYNLSGSVVGAASLLIIWNTEWDTDKLEDSWELTLIKQIPSQCSGSQMSLTVCCLRQRKCKIMVRDLNSTLTLFKGRNV